MLLDGEPFAAWLRTAKPPCAAILTAECTGCGVSSMVEETLEALGMESVVVAHPVRSLAAFLDDATSTRTTALGIRKVLVIDPVDSVLTEPNSSADLAEFLKSGKSKIPVVLAGIRMRSSKAKVADMVRARTWDIFQVHFQKLSTDVALRELAKVFPGKSNIEAVWENARGDFRNAVLGADLGEFKDHVVDGTDAVSALLFGKVSVAAGLRMIEGDSTVIASGIFENYLLTKQTVPTAADIADTFSIADTLDEFMYANQKFELFDVYNAVSAAAGGVLAKPSDPFTIVKYGSLWSKNSNIQTKKKTVRAISTYLAESGRAPLDVEGLAYWRMIGVRDRDVPDDIKSKLNRLWKAVPAPSTPSAPPAAPSALTSAEPVPTASKRRKK